MNTKKNTNYHDQQNVHNVEKMRAVMETLPGFCKQFFRGITEYTSSRTRLAYAYDLRVFFEYLHDKNPYCAKMEIAEFPLSLLDKLTREDIEEYVEYLSYYEKVINKSITLKMSQIISTLYLMMLVYEREMSKEWNVN